MRNLPIIAALAVITLIGTWFLFMRGDASANNQQYEIETATVDRGNVARLVSASGAVRALTTVEVGSQVSGQIIELMADYNSEVTEGEIIALIDPQTFETRVASAEADVASARAGLEVQRASIASSEATLKRVEKDYTRQKLLYDQDAIALSLLEDTERELSVAQANLQVSRAQLKTSQASLSQRLASLESAKVDLNRSIIRAPIDGVVIERNVDVGQTVAASFSAPVLFLIAQDLGDIRIDASVVEADIGGIDTGDTATFKVDAYPDETFQGVVEQVRLSAEELQNVVTYTVVIAATNPRGQLLPGMTANVEITAEQRENVLRISETATRFRPPTDGPQVVEAAARERGNNQEQGQRQGGGFDPISEMDIDDDRRELITAELAELRTELRSSFAGGGGGQGGDRDAIRQRFQSSTERVLRKHLTPEEFKTYQAAQNSRTAVRQVNLYQTTADGSLQTVPVGVGLSDGSYVEVLRGADVDDTFVERLLVQRDGS